MRASAEAVAALLKKRGLEKVELLELPGVHPYVYGERMRVKGAPTLLLYAHHDVQPPGREELWKTKPFEPTLAQGPGGERLYARGAADDKAGIVVHSASIGAILAACDELPLNVKIVIEGEEEVGSDHLTEFVEKYRDRLDADVLILTDSTNWDCGVPALSIALRGLVGVQVEVRALTKSVHSGMWGGPLPDPAMALSKMLATLVDEQGRIAIPGVLDGVNPVSADEEKEMLRLPFDEKNFREASGLIRGAKILREGPHPIAQTWRFPSLTVNAMQASSRGQAGNIINDVAWAKVTIRVVNGMDPERTLDLLKKQLLEQAPWGVEVSLTNDGCTGAWSIDPHSETKNRLAFEAASHAMELGYGVKPVFMGCGGTIPFVKPFAEALGGAPALLVGVEDPYTNAHGENESLLVSDFKKACVSQIHMFYELAERLSR